MGIFQKNGQRAVHKPLLTLMALAHVQAGKGPTLVFPEIETRLHELITEFGTTSTSNAAKAHYPFWYLQNDGFWQVENANELLPRKSKGAKAEPGITTMRQNRVRAGFTPEAYSLLTEEPTLLEEIAQTILTKWFPDTLRLDVLIAVGLDGNFHLPATIRDARFREDVLRAYSYACVVCGYDGRLGRNTIGLEAAHIRWVQFGGPNRVSNGLCMCALHHKIFDLGGFTIDPASRKFMVSKAFNGLGAPTRALQEIQGLQVRQPPIPEEAPLAAYLNWHMRHVFRTIG
jgi:putative restriction endonuclease